MQRLNKLVNQLSFCTCRQPGILWTIS